MNRLSWIERWHEFKRVWFGPRKKRGEVRLTAVGWQPDSTYQLDCKPTPSGNVEYYKVIRESEERDGN